MTGWRALKLYEEGRAVIHMACHGQERVLGIAYCSNPTWNGKPPLVICSSCKQRWTVWDFVDCGGVPQSAYAAPMLYRYTLRGTVA